jgi:hypothetical protein
VSATLVSILERCQQITGVGTIRQDSKPSNQQS